MKRHVINHAHQDVIWAEKINVLTHTTILNDLTSAYPDLSDRAINAACWDIELGEVLVDSRGRGTFQK